MSDSDARTIIVTGGGQGIGRGIVEYLVGEGADVVVLERDEQLAARLVEDLADVAGRVKTVVADVRADDAPARTVQAALEFNGRIDGLVNNAQGMVSGAPFESTALTDYEFTLSTGLLATVRFMQAVYPTMKSAGHGSVVNVTSAGVMRGQTYQSAYVATKSAVAGITRVAAREWGPYGVRVNCFGPSAMTPALEQFAAASPEDYATVLAEMPMGRFGDPLNDIAPAVAFLLSDQARFVNGQALFIDGGLYVSPS